MAQQSGNDGRVGSMTKSSTGNVVTITYQKTNPDPPPPTIDDPIEHAVTDDQWDDLLVLKMHDHRVDTVYDDGTGNPISTIHVP